MLTAPRAFFGSRPPTRTDSLPPAELPFVAPVRRQAVEGTTSASAHRPAGVPDSRGAVRTRHSAAVVRIAPLGAGRLLSGGCAGHRIAPGIAQ